MSEYPTEGYEVETDEMKQRSDESKMEVVSTAHVGRCDRIVPSTFIQCLSLSLCLKIGYLLGINCMS